jgi:Ca2+-binding RTX toxin-like protein
MIGGTGNDTFWFGKTDGSDTIADYTAGNDKIDLYNVNFAAAQFSRTDNGNSVISLNATDKLTVTGGTGNDTIYSVIDQTNVQKNVKVGLNGANFAYDATVNYYASTGNATLDATSANTSVTVNLYDTSKYSGVDSVKGGVGADYLRGNSRNNTLTAGDGGANLWGAAGNDTMIGGASADTYWFGAGDGNDTIAASAVNSMDTVVLYTSGLTTASVRSGLVNGTDLQIKIGSDSLTLTNWVAGGGNQLNTFQIGSDKYSVAADGITWSKI